MALTPQIDNGITNESQTNQITIPSKTYKLNLDVATPTNQINSNLSNNFAVDRIIGYVDNLEAVKQAIYHILMTERYAYLIYSRNYGVELEQYIGKDLDYIEATIEDTLSEALMYDLRITNVQVNNIEKVDNDKVLINFTANTIYGDLVLEVDINV